MAQPTALAYWVTLLLLTGAGSARSIRANPSPPPTSTSAAEDPSNPSLCVIVRTYWGHGGKEEDRGLRALLRSLQAQPLTRWQAIIVVMDSLAFDDLHPLLAEVGDERAWVFAEWIGQTYTPQNENGWTIGYHSKLYNLTDQALGACPPDTTWALVTNGDNIYEPAFFQQLATVGQSADVVAFDYYSRYQRATGQPCERFAAGPELPACKRNHFSWCHTDLGANAFSYQRWRHEGRQFSALETIIGASTGDHFDGFMANALRTDNWRVHYVEGQCLYDHSPSPQRCARQGGVWDDTNAASAHAGGGRCITRNEAERIMWACGPECEEVSVNLSHPGWQEKPLETQCLRDSNHIRGVKAMMRFFSSTCADEVDATAFRDLYHDFTESPTDPIALPLDWHHTVSNAKAISHSALKPPHIPPRNETMGGTKRAVYKGRPRPKLFNAELAAPDSAAPGATGLTITGSAFSEAKARELAAAEGKQGVEGGLGAQPTEQLPSPAKKRPRVVQVPLWVAQNRPPPPSWGEDHEL